MNKKEKQEKKSFISAAIDLANGRFKDSEVDRLYDLVKNREEYNGASKTHKRSYDSFSSDGRFTRDEETTFTFLSDENGVRIEERYQYHDDDGQSGSSVREHKTARDILSLLGDILR